MSIKIERISAIALKVARMEVAVGVLSRLKLLYGGPNDVFSSLRMAEAEYPIVNLETGILRRTGANSSFTWPTWMHLGII